MKSKLLTRISVAMIVFVMALSPINAYAATIIKRGDKGSEVKELQANLRELGFFKYHKITGYYGRITEDAVKRFQKANDIKVSGIVTKATRQELDMKSTDVKEEKRISTMSSKVVETKQIIGALDWFKQVRGVWHRGMVAEITDIDTGKSFRVKRTYGTNHADVEPLTLKDTKIIKEIWGGFSWKRRAVVVKFDHYTLAGSMSAMPHAGVDNKPANAILNKRSGGYKRGYNLDAVKNNGANGVMDLHFKNSRTHGTNQVQSSMQDMVKKAEKFLQTQ